MQGAREYYPFFSDGEKLGDMTIRTGEHARGKIFCIFILGVEVYGVLGGNPGWTEYYGWKRTGPWVEDFEREYRRRFNDWQREALAREEMDKLATIDKLNRETEILSRYTPYNPET